MSKPSTSSGVRARPFLTLAFFCYGFACLLGISAALMLFPDKLMGGYYQPWMLALTHALVLGWLGSVFAGAAYQLGPVISEHSLRWAWLGWVHLLLHAIGVPAMVGGFIRGDAHWILGGGILVMTGFVVFIITQVATASPRWRADAIGCGLVLGWFWLAVTLGLGLHMAWNRFQGLEPAPSPWLRVHALLGVLGFFLTIFNAVSLKLVPMFAVTRLQSPVRVWASLVLTQAGLQFVAPACLLPYSFLKWGAGLLITAGQILFLAEIFFQFRRRHRRLDGPLRWFVGSFLWLPPALAGLVFLFGQPSAWLPVDSPGSGAVLAMVVFLVGCLTTAILAMSFKIIPFLVWQAAYARYLGRWKTPGLSELVGTWMFRLALVASNLGIIGIVLSLSQQSAAEFRVSVMLFGAGVLGAFLNSLLAGRHIWKPRLEALTTVAK
jgi:hypothetical protein